MLAGGASSDEEDAPTNIEDGSTTPASIKHEKLAKTGNIRKPTGKKAGKRVTQDDSEEEGEA